MYSRTVSETEQVVNSITLSRGKKGEYGWDIKLFFLDGNEDECLKVLAVIDAKLHLAYDSGETEPKP